MHTYSRGRSALGGQNAFGFHGSNCQKRCFISHRLAVVVYLSGRMWPLNFFLILFLPSISVMCVLYREGYSFCHFRITSYKKSIFFKFPLFFLWFSCIMDAYVCEMNRLFMQWSCCEFRASKRSLFSPQIPRLLLWYVTYILNT